jgi:hypothetical protein
MAIVRARVGRYAEWQLRDYILGAGGITIVFVALLIWAGSRTTTISEGAVTHPSLDWLVNVVSLLGSIFATSNLISEDRSRGYYRFLFAKPLNPIRFYGQAFVLRGLVIVALAVCVAGMSTVIGRPVSLLGAAAFAALSYLLVGGVTVCQSTVWRFAWVGSLVLYVVSAPIAGLASADARLAPGWRIFWQVVHVLLPPFSQLSRSLLASAPYWGDVLGSIAWCIGYGILALVATVLVIRGFEWAR